MRSGKTRNLALRAFRGAFQLLSVVSRSLSAAFAETLFRTPPRQRKTRLESRLLSSATRDDVFARSGRLATWRWVGRGGPTILLVHGWGGHAARLSKFVQPLLMAGFSVVAFDAPAQGESAGTRASVPDFTSALLDLATAHGPFAGLIAHSVGASASVLAFRLGFAVERAVFIAPPASPDRYSRRLGRIYGIPRDVQESMKERFAERYRIKWRDLDIAGPGNTWPVKLLVFHDRRDSCVPIEEGAALVGSWPGAELVPTAGLGHHRILRDPGVVQRAVAFLHAGGLDATMEEERKAS